MQVDPEVESWFAARERPAEAILRRIREIILSADPRMSEHVKYGNVTFAFSGDMAAFVQAEKKTVSLMFMRGGKLKGAYHHLEGTGRAVRFMRFADLAEADALAPELSAVVRDWCEVMAPRR